MHWEPVLGTMDPKVWKTQSWTSESGMKQCVRKIIVFTKYDRLEAGVGKSGERLGELNRGRVLKEE